MCCYDESKAALCNFLLLRIFTKQKWMIQFSYILYAASELEYLLIQSAIP